MRTKGIFLTSLLSAGLILGSGSVANADVPSPTGTPVATTSPVATTYAEQLAAYKVALAAYPFAMDQYRAAWKTAMDQYTAAVQAATTQFKADLQLRKAKIKAISVAFQASITKARSDKKIADAAATSPDQKSAAQTILTAAISAAANIRQSALDALGPELLRPLIPPKPVRPSEPVKPVPPVKPAATLNPTTTSKNFAPKSVAPKTNLKKREKNN